MAKGKEKLRKKFQETKKTLGQVNKILGVEKPDAKTRLKNKFKETKKTLEQVNSILGIEKP